MENMTDDIFMKVRSSRACIGAGYRLFTGNFKRIFRYSWVAALIFAIIAGAVTTYFVSAYPKLVVGMISAQMTGQVESQSALPLVLMTAGVILVLLAFPVFLSYGVSQLRMHQSTGSIPYPTKMFSIDGRAAWRTLKCCLWLILIGIVIACAIGGVILFANRYLGQMAGFIAIVIVCICAVLVTIPFYYIAVKYLFSDKNGFWHSFGTNYTVGLSRFGFIFVIAIVDLIVSLVAALVTTLPSIILTSANLQAQAGVLAGDPIGMPSYITWLTFAVFIIAQFIRAYILMSVIFPFYFMHGSIMAQQEDRKSLSKMLSHHLEQKK